MPDNVSLNIPVNLLTPGSYIEVDTSRAVSGLPSQPRKIMVLGQRRFTGTLAPGVLTRVTSSAQAEIYFGRGSMLSRMLTALFGTMGKYCEVWAIGLADLESGIAAEKTITYSGTATQSGTLALYIVGQRVAVAVAAGDSATVIGSRVAAAINAQTDLPVDATAALGVVTVVAKNKGEAGRRIDLRHNYYQGEQFPSGITAAIATIVTGAGNPDISDAIAVMADEPWVTIVNPWVDDANMAALEAELDLRWGPLAAGGEAQQMSGHAFVAKDDTYANLLTWAATRNSPHVTAWGLYSCPTWTPERAAILAGVVEYHGGIDPARPFQTLPLPGTMQPAPANQFTRQERQLLLEGGIATAKESLGGGMQIERVITMYQQTAAGVPDVSLLDLNVKWTVDYIRYAVAARILLRFPRHKLADDGTRFHPGQAVATPSLVRAELLALFRDLEEAGLVENIEQFKQDLLVVRSASDVNRINAIVPPDVINQFRVFAAAIQFRL